KDYGKVYIWLMDEKELAFVSESFDEFINELS
ncbi:SMI1/KNR4 family protein, partial [Salmonella enterica]|nr:SMI1/KNR4 family protein [Salmonella enterica]EBF2883949.1 SMI1/KNR4 family protein [Salmonella enterica subsp. enterica serovar Senftenberg]ECY3810805.1 SMI1/KNR4 family protein [Salmonella enterica subsp. enterica serovar Montevideo]EDX5252819.1 SMI1/KNR4 family protein [Salmonella enterica subsp. enterica serovar Norwich]EBK0233648.1 SMI1/KNR4 family protein [Salmonella enterica]